MTTTTLVPWSRRASNRYFMNTGWLLAGFAPHSTTRSLSSTSASELVHAATPMVSRNALVDGA